MKSMKTWGRDGIVLVLVSGILTVMVVLSAMLLRLSGLSAATDAARGARVQAHLANESALAYAGSRLGREVGYPLSSVPALGNRGDDWMFRDPPATALRKAVNVSYAHGEPWDDDGDGLFEPGSGEGATIEDLDGDGRFSARSGRLRTAGDEASFALKITSVGGLFPVNFYGSLGGGASDLRLMRLGDNLGAMLLAANSAPERIDRRGGNTTTAELIRISALGRHLIAGEDLDLDRVLDPGEDANGNGLLDAGRPVGGYKSLDQVRSVLAGFGYGAAQVDRILAFLDLGPYDQSPPALDQTFIPTIELATASREILQAIWQYAAFMPSGDLDSLNLGAGNPGFPPHPPVPPKGLGLRYPRSGSQFQYAKSNIGASVMIYPEEASRIAGMAMTFRTTQQRSSWLAFRKALIAAATPPSDDPANWEGTLFEDDVAPLLAGSWTDAAWGWARAKADAAFFAVCPEGERTGWGVDHGVLPSPIPIPGYQRPFVGIGANSGFRFPSPALSGAWPENPYKAKDGSPDIPLPCALTLAPPTLFRVTSLARSGRSGVSAASGLFRAAERIEFTTQTDFEYAGSTTGSLAWRGIEVWSAKNPGLRRPVVADAVANLAVSGLSIDASQRGAVTGPAFNPSGCNYSASGAGASTSAGFLALAGKYTGDQWAYLYWPFSPDDDPALSPSGEAEWRSQSRLATLPPDFYATLGRDDPAQSRITPMDPWTVEVLNTDAACVPFDFPPLVNDGTRMQDWSIEFWMKHGGSFVLEGDTLAPYPPDERKFSLSVVGTAHHDPVDPKVTYTVRFLAPCSKRVTIDETGGGLDDDGAGSVPPQEESINYGSYKFEFSTTLSRISYGADPNDPADDRVSSGWDHFVITLENRLVNEDQNGDGVINTGYEDWNGDGVLGQCRDLTFTIYVNGLLAGTASDRKEMRKVLKPKYLGERRTDPGNTQSYPRSMHKDTVNKIQLKYVDEVKFYDEVKRADGSTSTVLSREDAEERYKLGRYLLPAGPLGDPGNPRFLSPAYLFSSPVTVKGAGWTGIPAGDPYGPERVGMRAVVGVPKTAPLRVEGPELAPTEGFSDPRYFASLGPVTSLGYSVEFGDLDPSNGRQLYATPTFEGLWVIIQGNRRSPAWIECD